MTLKIVRSAQAEWSQLPSHGRFGGRRKDLGGVKLTCGLWELAPGQRSFPLHVHHVTEEAMFVLSGRAKVRTPEGEVEIGPGDHVSFPAGGPAHQLINDGTEPLLYVGMSANAVGADIVEYPDSGKIAMTVASGGARQRAVFKKDQTVDYWDGEQ